MKFIISETGWDYLERLMYRGCIGLFYETTLQGMLAYIIFGLLLLFAVIGIITAIHLAISTRTINTESLPPVMAAFFI